MPTPKLTDRQKDILRFLAERYMSDGRMSERVSVGNIQRLDSETEGDIKNTLLYFQRMGWVKWATNESVSVQSAAADFIHQLDNPTPKNHLTELTVWWFSARWRAAVTLVTIVLPLCVQWIEMIQIILRWIEVLPEPK